MKYFNRFLAPLFLLTISLPVYAVGPTYVKDAVVAPTTWTKEDSPYILQNDITVSKGVVLTIAPGAEVRFVASNGGANGAGPNLIIQGGLKAVGTSVDPIQFNPAVAGSFWGAIYFGNSDSPNCVLQACLIKGGRIVCNNASPLITQCAIFGAKSSIEVEMNSAPQIVGNRITANGIAISLLADTASPIITGNEIYNNNYGFYIRDFGAPNVSGNKIYGNVKYNIVNSSTKSLSMPNNDFQTTDAQQIMRTIYDGAYNPSIGRVTFTPYVGMQTMQASAAMPGMPGAAQPSQTQAVQEQPKIQQEDLWSYGRPFDAMKISNVEAQKKKPSSVVKILAVGATAVVTVVLLFL
jgi:parallel beta-helix repeat protein